MKWNEEVEQHKYFTKHRTLCKCGHSVLVTEKKGYQLCNWCHNLVFINKEAELKYRNKEMLLKAKRKLEEYK